MKRLVCDILHSFLFKSLNFSGKKNIYLLKEEENLSLVYMKLKLWKIESLNWRWSKGFV